MTREELARLMDTALDEIPIPDFRAELARADSIALSRLMSATVTPTPATTEPEWLTPQEAAAVAKVSVKRFYELARGKAWTHRLTKRCLRIDGRAFRHWLASRR